jgi:hypothetical protein
MHQGTIIQKGIHDLFPEETLSSSRRVEADRDGVELLRRLNRAHAAEHPGDTRLDARIAASELAAKMQLSAPEAFDILSRISGDPCCLRIGEQGNGRLWPPLLACTTPWWNGAFDSCRCGAARREQRRTGTIMGVIPKELPHNGHERGSNPTTAAHP